MQIRIVAAAVALIATATSSHAACQEAELSTCELIVETMEPMQASLLEGQDTATYEVGDTLPANEYSILFNPEYYGLPAVDGYWRYYRVGDEVFKVHASTMEILEQVTTQSAMLR